MAWRCVRGDQPSEFIVHVPEELDPDRLGVLVYPDGSVTNRWADGVAGLPEEVRELAAEEETAYCPDCLEEAEWYEGSEE